MNKEECIKRASKFSTKTEFSKGDRPAYDFARNNNPLPKWKDSDFDE